MAQTLVQTGAELIVSGGTSGNVTLTGVGAGNLLTVSALSKNTSGVTFSVSDGVNTWSSAVQFASALTKTAAILYAANVAAGNTVVTVNCSAGSTFSALVQEWSGSDTAAPLVATDSHLDGSGTTSHVASSTGINPGAPCIAIVAAQFNGTVTDSPGTGYTSDTASDAASFREHQVFGTAPTAEQGQFSTTTTSRATAVIAAFKAAAGGASHGLLLRRRRAAV